MVEVVHFKLAVWNISIIRKKWQLSFKSFGIIATLFQTRLKLFLKWGLYYSWGFIFISSNIEPHFTSRTLERYIIPFTQAEPRAYSRVDHFLWDFFWDLYTRWTATLSINICESHKYLIAKPTPPFLVNLKHITSSSFRWWLNIFHTSPSLEKLLHKEHEVSFKMGHIKNSREDRGKPNIRTIAWTVTMIHFLLTQYRLIRAYTNKHTQTNN